MQAYGALMPMTIIHRILFCTCRAPSGYDLSVCLTDEGHWILPLASTEGKYALGVGRLVRIGGQQVIEPLVARLLQKPLGDH
jgi:hypothetical protein